MKNKNSKQILFKSLDSKLNESENKILSESLKDYSELSSMLNDVSEIRNKVKEYGKKDFSTDFESKLFRKTNSYFLSKENSVKVQDVFVLTFKKIGLSAALVLMLLSIYNLSAGNNDLIKSVFGSQVPDIKNSFDYTSQTILVDTK